MKGYPSNSGSVKSVICVVFHSQHEMIAVVNAQKMKPERRTASQVRGPTTIRRPKRMINTVRDVWKPV